MGIKSLSYETTPQGNPGKLPYQTLGLAGTIVEVGLVNPTG